MLDQVHNRVFGGDLGVGHTGTHHSQPLVAWCVRGRERAHPHMPTMQSTQPWAQSLAQHTHITALFERIGIDLMDGPPSPRANYEVVVVVDHATKRVDTNAMV